MASSRWFLWVAESSVQCQCKFHVSRERQPTVDWSLSWPKDCCVLGAVFWGWRTAYRTILYLQRRPTNALSKQHYISRDMGHLKQQWKQQDCRRLYGGGEQFCLQIWSALRFFKDKVVLVGFHLPIKRSSSVVDNWLDCRYDCEPPSSPYRCFCVILKKDDILCLSHGGQCNNWREP